MKPTRTQYLAYRCIDCKRVITAFEIEAAWEKSEREKKTYPLCPCGGCKVRPTNCKLWEELFLPRIWKLWWKAVVLPRWGR